MQSKPTSVATTVHIIQNRKGKAETYCRSPQRKSETHIRTNPQTHKEIPKSRLSKTGRIEGTERETGREPDRRKREVEK